MRVSTGLSAPSPSNPVMAALAKAPGDDEPVTDREAERIEEGERGLRDGRTVTGEQVRARLGPRPSATPTKPRETRKACRGTAGGVSWMRWILCRGRRRAPRESALVNGLRSRVARSPLPAGLVALLVGLFALLLVVMAFEEPKWAYYLFGAKEKLRVLEYLGVGMGGVLLAIGAVIANRRAVAMEETNRGAEDGRRQERLKNAIEHLGHESDSVRMGGAYELEQLARDTEDNDLRQTVLDILCAHIRQTTGDDEYREKHKSKPSTEIQSLLTLLFSRKHVVFKGCRIDLQGSRLNGADLTGARLQSANLEETQLRKAILHGAQLQSASFVEAQLQEAEFDGAQLQGASFVGAQLQGANFDKTQLQGANLLNSQLQGASIYWTQLQGAYLGGTQLQGATLYESQLQGVEFSGVLMDKAIIIRAQLQGVSNNRAQLQLVTGQLVICPPFKQRILAGIDQKSDLSGLSFWGGLNQETLDSLYIELSDEGARRLRGILEPLEPLELYIGKLESEELPKGSSATTGAYTKEEAERWIAEYEEAMRGVPKADG